MKRGFDYTGISAVTMCHDGEGNYLLGLRSDKCRDEHNRWDPIGSGGVEFGEDIEDAIKREVKEECGADVVKIEYLGFREVHREHEGNKTHYIAFDHKVEIKRDQASITEPDKCLELRWCKLADIPEPRHSQFPIFIEKYQDKL
jgi:ADP-ribose pyrophosphatase YjhB (NUDIX family)